MLKKGEIYEPCVTLLQVFSKGNGVYLEETVHFCAKFIIIRFGIDL